MAAVCVMSVWALLAYGFLGSNKAVQNHVNCLYVLYALDHTDPAMPRGSSFMTLTCFGVRSRES